MKNLTETEYCALIEATGQIVAALIQSYSNEVSVQDYIVDVFDSLRECYQAEPILIANDLESIKASVQPDYLVCLEDGKRLKMLKRYLRTNYDLTPEQYRKKWGLPANYPMVAPNYAKVRSALAKKIGLGKLKFSKGRAA